MRISELSRRTGVAVATIKFYLREGLLEPGEATSHNQADYDDRHERRLRLIRALVEVGRVPLANVRLVLEAIDDPRATLHQVAGAAQIAVSPPAPAEPGEGEEHARAEIAAYLKRLGWRVRASGAAAGELARSLATLRRLGWEVGPEVFDDYAAAASSLAERELSRTPAGEGRERTAEAVVVGTVVFEAALVALRRLAHEHHSARVLAPRRPRRR